MRIVVVVSDCPPFGNSIYFFLTVFSLITLSFLLPVNFIFQDVVDKNIAYFPLRTLAPWPRTSLPQKSGHPVFLATSPLSRGTLLSKGGGKLSIHFFCADGETIETVFRTIISDNQLSIYGAVSDLCDEYRICQARTGRLVLAEQSDPFCEPASLLMKTPTSSTDDLAQEEVLWQKYQERVDNPSQQNRVIKICTDA